MTIAEIALAVTLVAGAGWLVRGFANLRTTDPGFVADGLLTFDVSFQSQKYRDQTVALAAQTDLLDRLKSLPGVKAVGATSNFPLRGTQENSLYLQLHGEVADPRTPKGTRQRFVTPGFFDAMGIKLISGRDFTDADRMGSAPVVIVNRTFARHYLTGLDPLQTRFAAGYPTIDPTNEAAIIGIVDDVRQKFLTEAAEPAYYSPSAQFPGVRRQTVAVKTGLSDPTPLEAAIRDEVRQVDPQIAVDFDSASSIVASTIQRQQLGMTLMLVFGLTAVVLAAVGIYGVIAYATAQRRNEVATRLALGATPGHVFWLVLGQGRTLTIIGAAIGIAVAFVAGQIISSRLYEVHASDPTILGFATLLVAGIALVATTIPAYRASRTDPSRVLRSD
jgi:putative ABC transport system permease protein